ncbi:hypothetical protein BH747_02195 [Enterococcus villorum]|uniref:Uncharacterized protein n=1 Tax=Enterococcus villorum TaxID=112904 RepID=A0A1V8YGP7_9ENTE|nr:hypothetical protein [Enterococcus villorum]OQO71662.1 hypothetical protein BH747_02195 [Enterococcus villorum]OQO71797.1 hypothetical protein BH744_13385 [Enterococcus villorum]
MKIEDYIKLRKKHDGFDETNLKNKNESLQKLINYIFDYYKLLEEDKTPKKNQQLKELRRNVNYQYEIGSYSESIQRWLIKIFSQHNIKMNRILSKILDDIDFFLLISDENDWDKLSYDLYTKITNKYSYLSDYPVEILAFAKDYYGICNRKCGLEISQYKLSQKSKKFIKDIYSEYGINLIVWSKYYLEYFYSTITLWPVSHRIVTEENRKRTYQYKLNATRNAFDISKVLNKLSDSNDASDQLKKNKAVLVELLREVTRVHSLMGSS